MTPRATLTARRLEAVCAQRRLATLAFSLGAHATVAGVAPTLVLTLPSGAGHLYPLRAHPGELSTMEWLEVSDRVTHTPGARFALERDSTPLTPHQFLSALTRHAHAVNHDYPRPHRLDAWLLQPHGTRTPLRALPGPFPSAGDFKADRYATRQWSWVPPSAHPLITIAAPLNPHI